MAVHEAFLEQDLLDLQNKVEEKEKRIAELEKENAELEEQLKSYNGCGDWDNDFHTCRVYLQHEELQMYIDQLTKAKEYIKLLLMNCVGVYESTGKTIAEIQAEAEQFLKEVAK